MNAHLNHKLIKKAQLQLDELLRVELLLN